MTVLMHEGGLGHFAFLTTMILTKQNDLGSKLKSHWHSCFSYLTVSLNIWSLSVHVELILSLLLKLY